MALSFSILYIPVIKNHTGTMKNTTEKHNIWMLDHALHQQINYKSGSSLLHMDSGIVGPPLPLNTGLTPCHQQDCPGEAQWPMAEEQWPVAGAQGPVAESQGPVAEVQGPVTEVQGPVTEEQRPVAEVQEPVAEGQWPVAEVQGPVAEVQEPVTEACG